MKTYDKAQYRTTTGYWRFEEGKASQSFSSRVIQLIKFFKQQVEKLLGVQISKTSNLKRDEQHSVILNPRVLADRNQALAEKIKEFLSSLGLEASIQDIQQYIAAYNQVFKQITISNLHGGMGYNNGLLVYCFTKVVNPDAVVESGVWRGFSTALLDAASTPQTKLYCFDINLSKVEHRSPKARYFEHDIEGFQEPIVGNKILALLDDHVSHYDRLQWCRTKGIPYIIADDDLSVFAIHSDDWPPIPTVQMVMHYDKIPHQFEWVRWGRQAEANIEGLQCDVFQKEYYYTTAPDLFYLTGYKNTSPTSFLVKK